MHIANTSVICFVCGLYSYLVFAVQARYYEARDLSCPENSLHSGPFGYDVKMTIYLSVVDAYSTSSPPPRCRLAVRVPRISNMYQAMVLANFQHSRFFNFSARSDEQDGFVIQHINSIWTRRRIANWVLNDGDTGRPITQPITEVMMEDRRSFIWVYQAESRGENPHAFTGPCIRRTSPIYGNHPPDVTIVYLSVQFWSNIWPLCKIPVLFVDYSGVNLNDLMMEAMRQYRHLFSFQKYQNFHIFDINELTSNGEYSWKSYKADTEEELNPAMYLVPLEDGDHVIWRYVNEVGEARLKTAPPPEPRVGIEVTPSLADDTASERRDRVDGRGDMESQTGGNGTNNASRRCRYIHWAVIVTSVILPVLL